MKDHFINKLKDCGYSDRTANIVYDEFLKEHSFYELISFIKSLEKEYKKCG